MTEKKLGLLGLALLMLLVSNLHLYCRVTVDGRQLDGLYAPAAVKRAGQIAARAAEELLPGEAEAPRCRRACRLSLRRPDGDTAALTDALILAYPGIVLADGVFVNGVRLGTVESGAVLRERLRASILGQMPNAAVFGNISGDLRIRPIYSRAGHETNYDDMVLLISGMAPVIYVDQNGKLV